LNKSLKYGNGELEKFNSVPPNKIIPMYEIAVIEYKQTGSPLLKSLCDAMLQSSGRTIRAFRHAFVN
jgi:hypothetical protein